MVTQELAAGVSMSGRPFALALVVIAWAFIWSRLDDH
jgi:hypothetical protein